MKKPLPIGERNVSITVSLPPHIAEKLQRMADAAGRSRSNAVARLVEMAPEPK